MLCLDQKPEKGRININCMRAHKHAKLQCACGKQTRGVMEASASSDIVNIPLRFFGSPSEPIYTDNEHVSEESIRCRSKV